MVTAIFSTESECKRVTLKSIIIFIKIMCHFISYSVNIINSRLVKTKLVNLSVPPKSLVFQLYDVILSLEVMVNAIGYRSSVNVNYLAVVMRCL